MEQAMKDCINQNMLKEFLEENGSEVMNMLFTEFNLEDAKEVWAEEAEKRTRKELAIELLDILDVETIARKTKLSVKEIEELKQGLKV